MVSIPAKAIERIKEGLDTLIAILLSEAVPTTLWHQLRPTAPDAKVGASTPAASGRASGMTIASALPALRTDS